MSKVVVRTSKKQSNVKKREDRTSSVRHTFDPLTVESKNVHTVFLMLRSPEDYVVAQALAALDKFAMKNPENTQYLLTFDMITVIEPLLKHSELHVRRCATKLLAELSTQESIKKSIISDPTLIPFFADMFDKEEDLPLQEFSSAILAQLTQFHVCLPQFSDTEILATIFKRLRSQDPDIQNNSLRILSALMIDNEGVNNIVDHEDFDFKPLLSLTQSEYPVIQNASLDVLNTVTRLKDNDLVQSAFRESNGLDMLLDILEMFDWRDLHSAILSILGNVTDSPYSAPHITTASYTRRLLQYAEDINDPELIEAVLGVITKMAKTENGRRVLVENNVVDSLLRYLRDENTRVKRAACLAIGNIIQSQTALEMLIKENPLREVLSILKSEQEPWETRHGAAVALCNILDSDRYFCDLFLNLRQQDVLLHILKQPAGKVPVEMLITLLQCLGVLAINEGTRSRILESDITTAILPHLESPEAQLRIATCICLSAYACEPQVHENFIRGQGVAKLTSCLKHSLMPVRQAAACLLQLLACDNKVAAAFISSGVLFWMLKQKQTMNVCPAWETATETLFKSCLPAKFANLNRLDMQDVTGEVFYAIKKSGKTFEVVEELFENKAVPVHVVYVANFGKSSDFHASKGRKSKCRKKGDEKDDKDEIENYTKFINDQYLREYLDQFKSALREEEEKLSRLNIKDQATLLAQFVANKMCGVTKGNTCTNHSCELHIAELKRELTTTVIPLGFIRVGMHLERALLFKVLADQVGLPCALVRGEYGRTWVEIASPQMDNPEEIHSLHVEDLPSRLLKTSYVVDLVDKPGRLLPIGSFEAAAYCAFPSAEE